MKEKHTPETRKLRLFVIATLSIATTVALFALLFLSPKIPAPLTKVALTESGREKPHPSSITQTNTNAEPGRNSAVASGQSTISGPSGQYDPREADININPYAAGLREPGKTKRAWDASFLDGYRTASVGQSIQFELTAGIVAFGNLRIIQRDERGVTYMSGDLSAPETGKFFFLRPPQNGRAGNAVGVIEFAGSKTAYRIEPTGPNRAPELWQRRLDEVLCLSMATVNEEALGETAEAPPLRPDLVPEYIPSYNSNIVSLQSLPGAKGVVLLDYFGGYTPTWGGVSYSAPKVSNAEIRDVWKRVAEDYMPLNVNVTTDRKVFEAAPEGSRQRCVFSPDAPTAAGVAYYGSWNWGGDTVCWSKYLTGKSAAEVGSHEVGHTVGLSHQGTSTEGYFGGHSGPGNTGWAPIMGVGYYQPVATWAKGEYQDANDKQDELAVMITYNDVDYRPDDTGNALSSARYLEVYSNYTASAEGVIETTGDTDAFRFSTTGGTVTLTANPVGDWANLAVSATLANESGAIISSNNPQTQLAASISSYVPAGTYTFRVTGAGRNNPVSNGFSAYGSIGYYSVSGTVTGAVLPNRFSVSENAGLGTVVGTISANNPDGSPLIYTIVSGNTSNAFSISSSGVLTVANPPALNYETLAARSQFAVQFDLLVRIENTLDPALTEPARRVVVQVTDANELPVIAGSTNYILTGSPAGLEIATIQAKDPDLYTVLKYSITGGNTANLFAIGAGDGVLRLASVPSSAQAGVYNLTIRAMDSSSTPMIAYANVRVHVVLKTSSFVTGGIEWTAYDGISGSTVGELIRSSRFPADPTLVKQLSEMNSERDRADSYGSVMRGYLLPPVSGAYTFFLASDDNGALLLSPDTDPVNAQQIASIIGSGGTAWTSPYQWTSLASQQSAPQILTAGQAYYIEARQKENSGGDFLQVAWTGPCTGGQTNIIPGIFLSPATLNYQPRVTGFSAKVRRSTMQGSQIGRLQIKDPNPDQATTCSIISGNSLGIFAVDDDGSLSVADSALLSSTPTTNFSLLISVTDNGVPALTTRATVSLTIVPDIGLPAQLQREIFYNIKGGNLGDLTGNPRYPSQPDQLASMTSFDSAKDIADDYGSRVRALLVPPATGDYQFWISADNAAVLNLSTTSDPGDISTIASIPDGQYSDQDQWTKFPSQASSSIALTAGQMYYIEVIQKEDSGGDFLRVGWSGPTLPAGINIIGSSYLRPVDINTAPSAANLSVSVPQDGQANDFVTTFTASDSPLDVLTYYIVSGNTGSTFAIEKDTGKISIADNTLITNGTMSNFTLEVAVQDSGYGGMYPLKSTTALVNIRVLPAGAAVAGMVHRYSFTANANDLLGTANGTVVGGVSIVGGRAYFDGASGHIVLPGGMLGGYNNLSFEFWATIQNNGAWPEVFAFGQQGGGNTGYIAFIPRSSAGDYRLSYNPGNEYVITGPAGKTLDTSVPVYVACIYDQEMNLMSLYTNGVLSSSGTPPSGLNLANIRTNFAYLGKSLFADPYLKGSIDEFRIWNTALTPAQIALNSQAGPNITPAASTPLALRLVTASTNLNSGDTRQIQVYADFKQLSNVLVTAHVTRWSSTSPTVLQVATNGVAKGIYPGAATVNATFGGLTGGTNFFVALTYPVIIGHPASQTRAIGDDAIFTVSASGGDLLYQWYKNGGLIEGGTNATLVLRKIGFTDDAEYSVSVRNTRGQTSSGKATLAVVGPLLKHRWSFNANNGTDSVGGANATLRGSAFYSGGKLVLPGGTARQNCASIDIYNTLATCPSITVEAWFSMSSLQNNSRLWMFGNANSGNENGMSFIDFIPRAGADGFVPSMSFNSALGTEFNTRAGANPALMATGIEYHVAAVYDSVANQIRLYINGALADIGSMGGGNITQLHANEAYLGAAVQKSDLNLTGLLNELRIWNAPLTSENLASNYAAGPNTLVSHEPKVTLDMTTESGLSRIIWNYGVLEEADEIPGPWSTVTGATSPYVPDMTALRKYYRVRKNQ